MSSSIGENIRLTIFGESHGKAVGMTMEGIPAGLRLDLETLQRFLDRRAPGRSELSTPRREADRPEFLSGLKDGVVTGAPIAAVIRNSDTRSGDYEALKTLPRPGHADYTAQVKYFGHQDAAGDHRIAMSAAVAAAASENAVTILGAECAAKSYPRFWADLEALEVTE